MSISYFLVRLDQKQMFEMGKHVWLPTQGEGYENGDWGRYVDLAILRDAEKMRAHFENLWGTEDTGADKAYIRLVSEKIFYFARGADKVMQVNDADETLNHYYGDLGWPVIDSRNSCGC